MTRIYNLSAGPATLPVEVLEQVQKDLVEYSDAGMSVMEMSHRSQAFQAIMENAEALMRQLLEVPDNYKVLFLQGGASLQFAMVPMNLKKSGKVAYVDTGSWSAKAIKEAKVLGLDVDVIASSKDDNYTFIPEIDADFTQYDYVHVTSNNTIVGTEFQEFPDTGDTPLVADFSSNFMSGPIDVSKFGVIYAGAQKNLGPAGVTVVIIRDDLLGLNEGLSTMLDYKTHADKGSMFNTPPTFSVYVVQLVLQWLESQGGLAGIAAKNQAKAAILYDYLDQSDLFKSPVRKDSRSLMNVPFVTGDADVDAKFIAYATEKGFANIKGHRSVGGMRASIYNAFPHQGVVDLVEIMRQFEEENK